MVTTSPVKVKKLAEAVQAEAVQTTDVALGGKHYVCARKAIVREGFEMDSAKAGVLKQGTKIVALAAKKIPSGVVRVQFRDGWTSMATAKGVAVLEEITATPDLRLELMRTRQATPATHRPAASASRQRRASSPGSRSYHGDAAAAGSRQLAPLTTTGKAAARAVRRLRHSSARASWSPLSLSRARARATYSLCWIHHE